MTKALCVRCGEAHEYRDNIAETTFWGLITVNTETVISKSVDVKYTLIKGHGIDTRVIGSDEENKLCQDCWSDLVGRFLQGRSVNAVAGKEGL